MQLIELFALGVALGTDAFSVSVAIGLNKVNWKLIIKLSLIVALFHILMPLLGINLARLLDYFFGQYYFEETLKQLTEVIGAGLLMILGMIMLADSTKDNKYDEFYFELSNWTIVILAISVSIDALSVGFSLGMLDVKIFISCLILGFVAGIMVIIGLILGKRVGLVLANRAQVVGGIVLILLGIHFLCS